MASKINNLNTVTSYIYYMQHFQLLKLFLLYVHVKWLVLVMVGLEIEAVAVAVVGLELCLHGSTVEIVSYLFIAKSW